MFICTKYLPEMNYGPMWNMVVTRHSELCYKNWWKNLLYIQNLFGINSMVKIQLFHYIYIIPIYNYYHVWLIYQFIIIIICSV